MCAGQDSHPDAGTERSPFRELFDSRRLLLMLAVLLVEVAIFAAGLLTPISSAVRQSIQNQTSAQFASVPTATAPQLLSLIFAHNLPIALLEMVPVLGAVVFASSIYITGLAAQVSVGAYGYPGIFGGILLIFPYTFVEFSAYAVAVGASVMLILAWRRGRLMRELRVFALEVVVVGIVLLVAAMMETATRFSLAFGLVLWIPTGLSVAGIIVYSGRTRL